MDTLGFIALLMLVLLAALICVLVWFLGGLPGRIAKSRNHPYAQAITVGGWTTLLFAGVGWPFVLMWAYIVPRNGILKREALEAGLRQGETDGLGDDTLREEINALKKQLGNLSSKIGTTQGE